MCLWYEAACGGGGRLKVALASSLDGEEALMDTVAAFSQRQAASKFLPGESSDFFFFGKQHEDAMEREKMDVYDDNQ